MKKTLINDYITPMSYGLVRHVMLQDSCPIELDPLSIILDMRRYLVMEESKDRVS